MSVQQIAAPASAYLILPGAQFADCYETTIADPDSDAATIAKRIFSNSPAWVTSLLALRNRLGAIVGLKPAEKNRSGLTNQRYVGFFPVVEETGSRIVMGFDDWHLDFRVIVEAPPANRGLRHVTITTIVRTHNLMGRAYLAAIMPFHRAIARTMIAQASAAPFSPQGGEKVARSAG
jgi:hypothetical protein